MSRRTSAGRAGADDGATPPRTPGADSNNRSRTAAGRHLRARRGGPLWLKIAATVLAVVLVAGVGFVGVQYFRLQSNLTTAPLNLGTDAGDQPATYEDSGPMQILILGTDTRSHGNDGKYGSTDLSSGFGNSDVMMLLHLSADRQRATVVSFPRDLMVPLPACKDPETGVVYGPQASGQLNSALSYGGPGCTVEAINQITGLQIDHFMMADFNAVKELSETLGGVDVCVNQPIDDPSSKLHLPAGVSSIKGEQALAFLRTRKGFGDGSDIGRIRAQQSFLSSMVRKVKEDGTLSNIPKLYSIAETVTKNLTVDEGLSHITDLLAMANRLKDVDLSKVAFVTVPNQESPMNPNRVELKPEASHKLFQALVKDRDITAPSRNATAEATGPSTTAPPQSDNSTVPVQVKNASGSAGRDKDLAAMLVKDGYTLAKGAGTSAASPGTQVFYGPGYKDTAEQMAKSLGIGSAQVLSSSTATGVVVSVGADFTHGSRLSDSTGLGDLHGQTADQVTCQSSFGN